ncbi:MAG: hypothetical protein ACRCT1_20115 [Microcoleaceae cyanobacterium]|jgi:hypothetical protein
MRNRDAGWHRRLFPDISQLSPLYDEGEAGLEPVFDILPKNWV